jgi:hypothetical protein
MVIDAPFKMRGAFTCPAPAGINLILRFVSGPIMAIDGSVPDAVGCIRRTLFVPVTLPACTNEVPVDVICAAEIVLLKPTAPVNVGVPEKFPLRAAPAIVGLVSELTVTPLVVPWKTTVPLGDAIVRLREASRDRTSCSESDDEGTDSKLEPTTIGMWETP